MSRLIGKTAAITGAARGIGAEYAKKLASEGANVIVTDILDPAEVVAEINAAEGGSAVGMIVDVTSDDDLNAMVAKAESEFGALNIVVNNAGLFANLELKPFFQIDNGEFDKVMTVNARSIHHQSTRAQFTNRLKLRFLRWCARVVARSSTSPLVRSIMALLAYHITPHPKRLLSV